MAELREVSPPIIGRRLRILPYSTHPKNVCLRVELYGCPWTGCAFLSLLFKVLILIIYFWDIRGMVSS